MNNFEKIKQMTIDEMAEWILTNKLEKCKVCICKPNGMKKSKECKKYKTCDTPIFLGLKQWLLQEEEE